MLKNKLTEKFSLTSSKDEVQRIIIKSDGNSLIEWISIPFSKFIIDNVVNKEKQEQYKKFNVKRIYCG